ncbi:pilus assembly protein PilV [Pseudomonas fluorescens ABAC62]|nr:pilus assembly protein PilV [Pseudomonas fluorescens ABAC62]
MPGYLNTCFSRTSARHQIGMTLVEVLIATLILAVGLLGAAVLQLNALKYTDSSRMTSQASFIAYDMLDRIRANSGADYRLGEHVRAPVNSAMASVRDQDLHDFQANIRVFAGESGKGSVAVSANEVTVSLSWDERGTAGAAGARETFTLTSHIASGPGAMQ